LSSTSKFTLFGVGCIGSIVLLHLLSHRINPPKAVKPTKREIERKFRAEISKITRGIAVDPRAAKARSKAILFDEHLFGVIVQYLTTFDYLGAVCRVSRWHYVFLHHNATNQSLRKEVTCSMLWRESCLSWDRSQIGVYFNHPDPSTMDIYKFMHFVANNWKTAGCSKEIERDRHSEIIQQMICIPYIVPNLLVVQHWFRYISSKTRIPIKELCFKSETDAAVRTRKRLKHHFVSSTESPNDLHLFIWITIYNLYQMHSEIVRRTMATNSSNGECSKTVPSTTNQSGIRLNNFGFEHSLQKWLVMEHDFHFSTSETITLLKLYKMMVFEERKSSPFHVVFMLSVCIKILLHNSELHILKLRQRHRSAESYKEEALRIRNIFLENLGAVVAFTQYICRHGEVGGEDASFRAFRQMLDSLRIVAMIENMLGWFSRLSHGAVFHLCRSNALVTDMDEEYLALFGLKCKFYLESSAMRHYVAVWL